MKNSQWKIFLRIGSGLVWGGLNSHLNNLDRNICKTFLSLFPVKYSVINLFLLLAHMQFPTIDHYIHMSRHRKATIRTKWTFLCVCSYVCNDAEFETAYKQAPKRNLRLGKEKSSFIMFSFWGELLYLYKNCMDPCPRSIIHSLAQWQHWANIWTWEFSIFCMIDMVLKLVSGV